MRLVPLGVVGADNVFKIAVNAEYAEISCKFRPCFGGYNAKLAAGRFQPLKQMGNLIEYAYAVLYFSYFPAIVQRKGNIRDVQQGKCDPGGYSQRKSKLLRSDGGTLYIFDGIFKRIKHGLSGIY